MIYELKKALTVYFCFLFLAVSAQDAEVDLTKNFKFREGIYFSFKAMRQNKPDLSWSDTKANLFTNPQTFITQVFSIEQKGVSMKLDSIWGICVDGLPFVRLPDEFQKKTGLLFAGLLVRGKICYFAYEVEEEKEIDMPVYNPITRKPFRNTKVKRKVSTMEEKMLHFESGEIVDFNLQNFKDWIRDDQDLLYSVNQLGQQTDKDELFQFLLDYSDRNVIFIPE